jgi:pyruvate dehydrogenase E1 component
VAVSHIEALLASLSRDCLLVTVIDGHPATLSWLGSVHGHKVAGLGVEHFGQTGTVADLYRHVGIDRNSILRVIAGLAPGRPHRAVGGI